MQISRKKFRDTIIEKHLEGKNIVLVNVGTEKVIGDSFGPLLGSMLKGQLNIIKIYGTLDDTIMAYNVEEKAQYINKKHKNDLIIATDCCFSENEKLLKEDFSIRSGPIRPGAGIGRDLPSIGDMNILFCMSEEEVGGFSTLKNKTIKEVYNRTRKAAEFIFDLDEELSNINNNRQVVK